ncbi:hypothetical protein RJ55_02798 [Drechmeria coniospora]|nr:hypothetical protein RJ55_02798 [Drechmeria coniospora]
MPLGLDGLGEMQPLIGCHLVPPTFRRPSSGKPSPWPHLGGANPPTRANGQRQVEARWTRGRAQPVDGRWAMGDGRNAGRCWADAPRHGVGGTLQSASPGTPTRPSTRENLILPPRDSSRPPTSRLTGDGAPAWRASSIGPGWPIPSDPPPTRPEGEAAEHLQGGQGLRGTHAGRGAGHRRWAWGGGGSRGRGRGGASSNLRHRCRPHVRKSEPSSSLGDGIPGNERRARVEAGSRRWRWRDGPQNAPACRAGGQVGRGPGTAGAGTAGRARAGSTNRPMGADPIGGRRQQVRPNLPPRVQEPRAPMPAGASRSTGGECLRISHHEHERALRTGCSPRALLLHWGAL